MKKHLKIFSYIFMILLVNAGTCYAKSGDVPHVPMPIVKFLSAMLGVLISAGVIYLGLKLYKKIIFRSNKNIDNTDYSTLHSPKNFKEAINIFLDKTDK